MSRPVLMLICVQLVDALGLGLLLPVLPYFIQAFGATAVEVTQLVAVYALAGMVASPPLGRLSDKLGRKRLVLCCALVSAAAYMGYLLAESMAAVFCVRIVSGIAAAKGGVVNAWLLDLVSEEDRARYLGLLGSMNGIGMLLGPIVASLVLFGSGESYTAVFAGGAVLSLVAAAIVLCIPAASPSAEISSNRTNAAACRHLDLLALNFCVFLAFSVLFSVSVIYMQARFGWDAAKAGLAVGLMTGTVAFARALIAHRLLAAVGLERGIAITGVGMGLALLLCTLPSSSIGFLPLYCLAAAGYAIAALGVTVALAKRLTVGERGAGMGRLGAASSAAIVVGAATHGYLFQNLTPAAPFQMYGLLAAFCVAGWYWVNTRRRSVAHE